MPPSYATMRRSLLTGAAGVASGSPAAAAVAGSSSSLLSSFRFESGVTPLAEFHVALLTCCGYLLTLQIIKTVMANRQAFDLKKVSSEQSGQQASERARVR